MKNVMFSKINSVYHFRWKTMPTKLNTDSCVYAVFERNYCAFCDALWKCSIYISVLYTLFCDAIGSFFCKWLMKLTFFLWPFVKIHNILLSYFFYIWTSDRFFAIFRKESLYHKTCQLISDCKSCLSVARKNHEFQRCFPAKKFAKCVNLSPKNLMKFDKHLQELIIISKFGIFWKIAKSFDKILLFRMFF